MERGLLIPFALIPVLLFTGTVVIALTTNNPAEAYEGLLALDFVIALPLFLIDVSLLFAWIIPGGESAI